MRKKRILWCGEASFLNTGFAIYAKEILRRLWSTQKYEIAEFASYGEVDDDRRFGLPWTYYGNMPSKTEGRGVYDSVPSYQFGQWRFEEVCLDFKPDIVCDVRDWWMIQHEMTSALRDYYRWVIMPAVDCHPLREECVEMLLDADTILSYSEYGRDVINKSTYGLGVETADICSPAASPQFSPVQDKKAHKENIGFMDGVKIIGTVMRNQKRKLFPELIKSFADFVETCPKESKNTFLYLHTSYPDIGWDIPRLIKESGVSSRILLTYHCSNDMCKQWFPSFYRGESIFCSSCGKKTAFLANPMTNLPDSELSKIINLFDIYVQYSICEGFGMPQVEAAMCGVPVISVDHSAMSSVIKNIGAIPIRPAVTFRELETHGNRAYPDNKILTRELKKFFSLPKSVREKKGRDMYVNAKERYSWDRTAKKWENTIDSLDPVSESFSWDSQPKILPAASDGPENINDMCSDDLVKWGILNVLRDPSKMNSLLHLGLSKKLDSGVSVIRNDYGKTESSPFYLKDMMKQLYDIRAIKNIWEEERVLPNRVSPEFCIKAKKEKLG